MSKRQEIRERRKKQQQQRKMMTIGAIIIGAGLIAAALIYPSTQMNNIEFASRYMAQDNAMGNPDAPIKIVEYSGYKCGHCAAFTFETEPLLEEEYIKTDKVHFTSIAVWDDISAEASYCAGEQNKYWEMRDVIFSNQAVAFSVGVMEKWAKTVGVDVGQYKECMTDNTYMDRVAQDNADAQAAGVEGTPSFIITYMVDGEEVQQMLPGNYPYEAFQQIIEEALAEMGL